MILFNTTFCVDSAIAPAFIAFVKDTYLPLATGSGLHSVLLTEMRAAAEPDASGKLPRTLALQMRAPSDKVLNDFRSDILPALYESMARQWGMGVAMFESILDVLHDLSAQ